MTLRVVCLGEPMAGDDGVGVVVASQLAAAGVPAELLVDPLGLVELAARPEPLLIVDALATSGAEGRLLWLSLEDLARDAQPISSHRVGVAAALELARALSPLPPVEVLAITIRAPERLGPGLSPQVARAAELAARAIVERLRSYSSPSR